MSRSGKDNGFTLIELLVTIALLSVMMTLSISGWAAWSKSSDQSGTATELESGLRQAQQRAVTEGRAMCVKIDVGADAYSVHQGECSAMGVKVLGPVETGADNVQLDAPGFTADSVVSSNVTFYARGTASPGTVKVTRTGSSKVYTVHVEGLTGRVSLT